jgi:heme exporter protein CcmD
MQWFLMHGYGVYVWSAYGIVGIVLGFKVWQLKRRRQIIHKRIKQWLTL